MKKGIIFGFIFVLVAMLMVGCATQQPTIKYPVYNPPTIIEAGDMEKTAQLVIAELEKNLVDQPKISNVWRNKDIRRVFQDIATQAKVNIFCDDTVESSVITLELNNMPLEQALKMVLQPKYFFKKLDNGSYFVGSGAPNTPSALALSEKTEMFVTNRPADEILLLLSADLMPFAKAIKGEHALAVNAPREILERIKKDLAVLDAPQPLVNIKFYITEVTNTKGGSTGIDWGQILNISTSAVADLKRGVEWTYSGGLKGDLASSIQALAEQGVLKLRANPEIVVCNGEEGEINIVRDKYVSLARDSGKNDSPYYWRQEFEAKPITSGVKMKVKPQISREGKIATTLQIESSDMNQPSDDGKLPVVQRREVKTVVLVGSGDTIVIGGLRQELSREIRRGLPILSKIPVLNFLFSKKEIETQNVELVIFVTPGIVK